MKTTFNRALYKDSLLRLRLGGIVFCVICVLFSCMPYVLGANNQYVLGIQEIAPILGLYMFIGPITLTFTAFSFLFRRSASDVYHALPLTRTGLFTANAAAVLTWVIGTVLLTVLAAFGCMALFGWPVDGGYILPIMAGYSFGALLVTACVTIGVAATGTRFAAFVVAGLVLFLPRFISAVCVTVLGSTAPMLLPFEMGAFFDLRLNFPVSSFLIQLFGGSFPAFSSDVSAETHFLSLDTHLYTVSLGLIYLALGGFIFARRASETAEKSAPGRITQHIYRCLLAMPLLLLLCVISIMAINRGYLDSTSFFVLLFVALPVYFVYELITTRRWKNLLGALYVLPILVGVCFAIVYGSMLYGNMERHNVPSPGETQSVQLYDDIYGVPSYQQLTLREVVFDDAELLRIVSEGLTFSNTNLDSKNNISLNRTMRINLKNGATLYRRFAENYADTGRLDALMQENPAYITASTAMPLDTEIRQIDAYCGDKLAPTPALTQIWEQYRAELAAQSGSQYTAFSRMYANAVRYESLPLTFNEGMPELQFYFEVTGVHNGAMFTQTYRLTQQTPLASNMAMRYVNGNANKALQDMRGIIGREEISWVNVSFQLCNIDMDGVKKNSEWDSFRFSGESEATEENEDMEFSGAQVLELLKILVACDTIEPDINAPFVQYDARAQTTGADGELEHQYLPTVYARLDEAAIAKIRALMLWPEEEAPAS